MQDFNDLNDLGALNRPQRRRSVGRTVGFTVLAAVLGLAMPLVLSIELIMPMFGLSMNAAMLTTSVASALMTTTPFLLLTVPLSAALERAAGRVPAYVLLGVSTLAMLLMGPVYALMYALAVLPCAIVVIGGVRAAKPFSEQVRMALIAAVGGLFALVLTALICFGRDMIGTAAEEFNTMYMTNLRFMYPALRSNFAASGVEVSLEELQQASSEVIGLVVNYYRDYLLSNLLCGAVLSALMALLWGNWLSARHGDATTQSFVGIHEWFLPANLTYGLLLMFAASVVVGLTGLAGAGKTAIIVRGLCVMAFAIQGVGAWDRRMKDSGRSRTYRTVWIAVFMVAGLLGGVRLFGLSLFRLMALGGVWSALFGRKGALKPKIDEMKTRDE